IQNIQNLPIDIQTSKLSDWLLDRRHCNVKWQSAIKTIREKINTAIQDMPENEEIKQLLSGSYIHYFHCLRIVEILKGTEASSKNIFGRYSSQRMKDWQEIISLYEADNVYLGEWVSIMHLTDIETFRLFVFGPVSSHAVVCRSEPVLPMLTFAQKKGNVTFYEWKTGKVPVVVERPVVEEVIPEALTENTIDWGDFGTGADGVGVNAVVAVEDGIDWGISLDSTSEGADAGGIDWGDSNVAPVEIELVDVGTDCPEGVARGEDALSLLENSQSRSQFIDELMELETFLTQRICEMGEEGDVVAMSQFQLAPSVIQNQTQGHVQDMLSQVQDLLGRLTSLRMQHLFTIQASPRYVERVSEMLRQKLKQADILVLKAATMAEKRQEALQEQCRLEPCVDLLAGCTRELQKLIEADISKRYHNRPVNLMGVNI
uniref:CDK5 regulatory subunit associated protein 3 n=1 Tax=Nothobranchius furzeri TaxID=105023 RepID=A0A8C6LV42_NOTFU